MVRSSVSAFGAIAAFGAADTLVAGRLVPAELVLGGVTGTWLPLPGPGVAGAVWAGRLPCGVTAGGFGPKNLAHARITTSERSDATTMRSSCVSLNFFCGSLTNAPLPVW